MTFLNPWAAAIAGALAVPVLLLLYFLKLRRAPQRIPSTLLWMKSVQDLEVNAPFQRLRVSLLFLLQFLVVALVVLAIGRPVIDAGAGGDGRLILIIDRSASMNAYEEGTEVIRLDRAKLAAKAIVDRLGRRGEVSELMIIAFGRTAQVVSGFESNRSVLHQAIEGIHPSDEVADLEAALQLADAFAAGADAEDVRPPSVVLVSDGGVGSGENGAEATRFRVRAESFQFVRIGPEPGTETANLGVSAITARRNLEQPETVNVFIRLVNASPQEREAVITLLVNDSPEVVRRATVPPAAAATVSQEAPPGEAVQSFDVVLADAGVVTARIASESDLLPADDLAAIVVPAPALPRVCIVAPEGRADPFVLGLFDAAAVESVDVLTPQQVESLRENRSAPFPFDFLVFDRVAVDRLTPEPSLTFGAAPPGVAMELTGEDGASRFLSWSRRSPIMRHVELDEIVFAGFGGYVIPEPMEDDVTVLARGPGGPVVLQVQQRDVPHVFVGFELLQSNWPPHVSVLVFLQNVLDAAAVGRGAGDGIAYRAGAPVSVEPQPQADAVVIQSPQPILVSTEGRDRITIPAPRQAGLYSVEGARPPRHILAVNVASETESDIRPRESVTVNAETIAGGGVEQAASRELWPWLIAAVTLLLILEWLVYTRRASL